MLRHSPLKQVAVLTPTRLVLGSVLTAIIFINATASSFAQTADHANPNETQPVAQNMLANGQFSRDTIHQGVPVGWQQSTWGGEPIFQLDRKHGHAEKFSVKISSDDGANASWSTRVDVKPNSVYRLTAWVKTENLDAGQGLGALVNLHELQLEGKSKGLQGTQDWTQLSVEGNSNARTSLLVILTFGAWGDATGTAWFDDVQLIEISTPDVPEPMDEKAAIAFYTEKVKPILEASCFECHANDPEDLGGSLALTSRASIYRGGDTGPAVDPNAVDESLLLQVINYKVYEMPPAGKLSVDKIKTLKRWVELGMPFAPGEERDLTAETHSTVPQVNEETKQWWSFQQLASPALPEVTNQAWPQNEIDRFVLARLESASLTPAPPASRQALIRRAYYDLTGLPPTPAQVESFVNNNDPAAYRNLIDKLLDSPHYGEKWGRHWLDLVRYAESNSFERDGTKPFVWRYRDYVIRAFNDDKPYDQFLVEQLAGDEIETPTTDSIIATGYYRLGQWDDEPVDPLAAKYDDLDDIVATTSQTMLGLTVNCARCHDHKIDPIPQADYYKMVSFFENIHRYGVRSDDTVQANSVRTIAGSATPAETERHASKVKDLEAEIAAIVKIASPGFESVEHEDFQYEMNKLAIMKKRVGKQITQKQFNNFRNLQNQKKKLAENPPGSIKVLCVKEDGNTVADSFIRIRGNANVKGPQVKPGFISVLSPPDAKIKATETSTGRRLAFAKWLVDPQNPMTSRVMANRIWQYHFGRGIVRTTSDFGFQGAQPTHPELLDWLAAEFIKQKWSMKKMHRLIMNSNAYQMSSEFRPEGYDRDPANDLIWRFNLRRLTAEEIRDSILAVAGELNREKMFGPSIFTIMPQEVLAGQSRPGKGWGQSSEEDRRRRSIYIHVKRSLGVPILTTNDSADTDSTCPVRFITTQPTQALGMLNSEFTNRQARHFAAEIKQQHPADPREQIKAILERVTQRPTTPADIDRGSELIQSWIEQENTSADQALELFCLLAINLNEFAYVD